ncbi:MULTISPECIES: ABC transporter ATP-binding protein [unclassified Streptomyces]|uniref:ABC transporter transmembrane domain-containing protein n=1 Tax=unclassified Streptomyces TaxID=2593676 RepID=UPI000DB96589|nr:MULTISPECIES: ABC transporter ATP-binding protein [unclassified Streptomyces]MYT69155.1 ATP-binding cassette domain-containing protein [Streptomyces sp. SID8367]
MVRRERRAVAASCVLGIFHQIGEALVPVLIGVVVDRAVVRHDGTALLRWAAVLAVVYLFLSGGFRLGSRLAEQAAERAAHTLRLGLVERALARVGRAGPEHAAGALTTVATEDARRLGALCVAVPIAVGALVGVAAGAVFLLRTSVPLGLLVLLGTPVLMLLGHLLARPLEQRSHTEQARAAHTAAVATDLVAGVRVLQGLGARGAAAARYRISSRQALLATVRAARAEALQAGLMQALTGVFIALVAYVGARLALDGSIGLGELVAAVGLALFLPGPLQGMAWATAELARARASARRIADATAAPPSVPPPTEEALPTPRPTASALAVRGLPGQGLAGLELHVATGELLGVVIAPDQAQLLLRCLAGRAGGTVAHVELDGDPAPTDDAPRPRLLVAAHDAALFSGSLRDNVTAAAAPDLNLDAVLHASGVHEIAASLDGGLDAPVGERGRALSGGQRQRVALARALAADPPVLVLHDPTTAVDAVTEARIATGLRGLRRERTTLLVTSSPALLAAADRVVLVESGQITADAAHRELVRSHAAYRSAVLA